MTVHFLGIDLAKNVFQLHGEDDEGHVIYRKRLGRARLLEEVGRLSPCQIGIEACTGALPPIHQRKHLKLHPVGWSEFLRPPAIFCAILDDLASACTRPANIAPPWNCAEDALDHRTQVHSGHLEAYAQRAAREALP